MSLFNSHAQSPIVHVVGGGLAGCEAAYLLAERGIRVALYEMRPKKMTQAHRSGQLGELVCSNSLKSQVLDSATGVLKAELSYAGSLIMRSAGASRVPAGEALAVDREVFSEIISHSLKSHSNVSVIEEEVLAPFPGAVTLLSTGPLTSDSLSYWIQKNSKEEHLYFYDAIAPIVDAATIDRHHSFYGNRYEKGGEEAYLNCPLNKEEYESFIDALITAEKVVPRSFEKEKFFQGCQPIEAIVATGRETLRFGPMKPVGLTDPRTGTTAHAVVQLRPENKSRTAFNMVGFQTKLTYSEQKRVFRMIPALKNAEFFRMGSIHRNTYVCAPAVLRPDLSFIGHPLVYLGGQLTGVEGYLESAASGLLAALFIEQRIRGKPHRAPPVTTALGALLHHITASDPAHYQPANMHFGLWDPLWFDELSAKGRGGVRVAMAQRALENFKAWWSL